MSNNESLILIIEDDDIVARTVSRTLVRDNYRVKHVNNGVDGLKAAREYSPDLIILDVVMQGMDGYAVCKDIRKDPLIKDTPVLFLTAKIKDQDRVMGLQAGADDYLTKPFNIDELTLRVKAILRRSKVAAPVMEPEAVGEPGAEMDNQMPVDPSIVVVGDYALDTKAYELITPHKGRILLTPIQYELVYYMSTHADMIFSPTRLLEEVWNFPPDTGSPDLVRVHVKNLRKRIEQDPSDPKFIQTVPGYGYTIKSAS